MGESVSLRQKRLAALLRATSGVIRIDDAVKILQLDRQKAAKLLAGWHKQGVIRRVAHGLYVPISPAALGQEQVLEDPWVLVPELYEPGYVGGWSALEYWDLTEQTFRTVCVLTSKRASYGNAIHQGVGFFIKHIPAKQIFGTKTVWRGSTKIQVSDPHKTILDIVDEVTLGAGLQHTMDAVAVYAKAYDSREYRQKLLDYAIQTGNGALVKKLGYIAETLRLDDWFVAECRNHLTKGYACLDKKSGQEKLITKWRLWVPTGYYSND